MLRKIFRRHARGDDPMLVLNMSIFNFTDGWSHTFPSMNMRASGPDNRPSVTAVTYGATSSRMRNGDTRDAMNAAQGSIVVKASVADVYKRWLEFEDYPKFITAIKRVRKSDEKHFSASLAFDGKQHEATLEIMLRVPERRLAWRTVSNGHAPDHFAAGVVSFASRPNSSTCVNFKLTSRFGGAVSNRVDKYLHNFKRLV